MMKLLKTYGRKLIRNFYLVVGLAFLVWMSVFDTNNWLNQYRLRSKLEKLKEEEVYYLEQIEVVQKDRQELLSNKRSIEKFAREKYLMKKPSEDLFVIEYKK
ncbi:FtsB family cell division protein [Fulvitalea axinellae]